MNIDLLNLTDDDLNESLEQLFKTSIDMIEMQKAYLEAYQYFYMLNTIGAETPTLTKDRKNWLRKYTYLFHKILDEQGTG